MNTITALQATYGIYGEDQQGFDRTPDQVSPYLTIRFNEAMDDLEMVAVTLEDALWLGCRTGTEGATTVAQVRHQLCGGVVTG